MQLEFRYLSQHVGKRSYGEKAVKAIEVLRKHSKRHGLYPIYISPQTGAVRGLVRGSGSTASHLSCFPLLWFVSWLH